MHMVCTLFCYDRVHLLCHLSNMAKCITVSMKPWYHNHSKSKHNKLCTYLMRYAIYVTVKRLVSVFILTVTLNQFWFDISYIDTVYPKKYAHGFCFALLCCGYTLTDFPISIRLTSLALWQSNDCPSASKATLMNMDKYFMWIHYERLHNHNKAKHNKTVCIFLGICCSHVYIFTNYHILQCALKGHSMTWVWLAW